MNLPVLFFWGLLLLDIAIKLLLSKVDINLGSLHIGAMEVQRESAALFQNLPPNVQGVVVMTVAGFVAFIFNAVAILDSDRISSLLRPLAFLCAGLAASFLDVGINGHVTGLFGVVSANEGGINFVINFADIYSAIGIPWLIWSFYQNRDRLFARRDYKRSYWIDAEFQTRYSLILCAMGVAFALIVGGFSYSFLVAMMSWLGQDFSNQMVVGILLLFPILFCMITLLYLAMLLIFARRVTHRVAGPVAIFERSVRELLDGREARFKLRDDDEFKRLEALFAEIEKSLATHKKT